jgi:hypothetical protein
MQYDETKKKQKKKQSFWARYAAREAMKKLQGGPGGCK